MLVVCQPSRVLALGADEPFFSQAEYQKLYPHAWDGPDFDWPAYREVREDQQTVEHIRFMCASAGPACRSSCCARPSLLFSHASE